MTTNRPTSRFIYTVIVETDSPIHADQVIAERIQHDEQYTDEYGVEFDYRIDTLDGMSYETRKLNAYDDLLDALEDYLAVTTDPTAKRWPDPDAIRESQAELRNKITAVREVR